jgi:phenylalanyl-tRNA synthetase beta chain
MLNMLAYNLNRGSDNLRLFEAGSVFEAENGAAAELKRICIGASGSAVSPNVHQPPRPFSFFDLKGDVETLVQMFQHDIVVFDGQTAEYYHPGRSARVVMDGATVAQFGQLHPETTAKRKFKQDVFIAELYLDRLYRRSLREVRYEALPRFPAVERDFSFILADTVVFEQVRKAVIGLHLSELRSFVPAEIFRGGAVPSGKYSLLLRATFQSSERTLREDEVARWSAQIVKALEGLGGTLRKS